MLDKIFETNNDGKLSYFHRFLTIELINVYSRRSQYDRGTRLAELEDSNYDLSSLALRTPETGFRSARPFSVFTEQYTSDRGIPYY